MTGSEHDKTCCFFKPSSLKEVDLCDRKNSLATLKLWQVGGAGGVKLPVLNKNLSRIRIINKRHPVTAPHPELGFSSGQWVTVL